MEEENLDYEEDDGQYEEGGGEGETKDESQDPEAMKRRVEEMENELEKLTKMQQQVERQINTAADKIDENSIYIGQVDYEATIDELRVHFAPCGTLNRITIVCDPVTHHPKGYDSLCPILFYYLTICVMIVFFHQFLLLFFSITACYRTSCCSYAYIEFADKEAVENALKLDDTLFKGRQLKVRKGRDRILIL